MVEAEERRIDWEEPLPWMLALAAAATLLGWAARG